MQDEEEVDIDDDDASLNEIEEDHENEKSLRGNLGSQIDSKTCKRVFTRNKITKRQRTLYVCKFPGCNKVFNKSSNFIVHQRRHTGKKPFECGVCHVSFTQSGTLKRHNRVRHPQANSDSIQNSMAAVIKKN